MAKSLIKPIQRFIHTKYTEPETVWFFSFFLEAKHSDRERESEIQSENKKYEQHLSV